MGGNDMTPKFKVVVTDYEYQSLHWEEKEVASVGGILGSLWVEN